MIQIINDPFETLIEVVTEIHGEIDAIVQFGQIDGEHIGETCFPDDGSTPVITISVEIPYHATIETFAHELAHVLAGVEAEHGKEWEQAFSNIHEAFMEKQFRALG